MWLFVICNEGDTDQSDVYEQNMNKPRGIHRNRYLLSPHNIWEKTDLYA